MCCLLYKDLQFLRGGLWERRGGGGGGGEREGGKERQEDEMFYDLVIGGLYWHTSDTTDFGSTETSRLATQPRYSTC